MNDPANSSSPPEGLDETIEATQQETESAIDEVLNEAAEATSQPATDSARVAAAEAEVLRSRAELENFRKRMQRDTEQQVKFANMPLVRDLLEVVDNLNRALDAAQVTEGEASSDSEALAKGVRMVTEQFVGTLNKFGCSAIEALGKEFDPNFHEAIAQVASEEYPSGTVAQEVAVGYVLHDRVVRPTQVIVSTGPAQASAE